MTSTGLQSIIAPTDCSVWIRGHASVHFEQEVRADQVGLGGDKPARCQRFRMLVSRQTSHLKAFPGRGRIVRSSRRMLSQTVVNSTGGANMGFAPWTCGINAGSDQSIRISRLTSRAFYESEASTGKGSPFDTSSS